MKKTLTVVVAGAIICGGLATYLFWSHNQPRPEVAQVQSVPPTTKAEPLKMEVRRVLEAPPEQTALPKLSDSDSFMLKALIDLIDNPSLMQIFHTERIIHNITATIDNLTYRRVPANVMPVDSAPKKFITNGTEGNLSISPKNAARYANYMKIIQAIDSKKLITLYVRLYPLFQQSYEELGYPKKYFNDRLIEVFDNLLDAPDIKEPVKLVQSTLFYKYADSDLESRSIGQRILMRLGSSNEAIVKLKLQEIKQELELHMHEKISGRNMGVF